MPPSGIYCFAVTTHCMHANGCFACHLQHTHNIRLLHTRAHNTPLRYRCPVGPGKLSELSERSDVAGLRQAGGHLAVWCFTAFATWHYFAVGQWGRMLMMLWVSTWSLFHLHNGTARFSSTSSSWYLHLLNSCNTTFRPTASVTLPSDQTQPPRPLPPLVRMLS